MSGRRLCLCLVFLTGYAGGVLAQTVSHRGFVEGVIYAFPQATPEDRARLIGDFLAREEISVKPAAWMQFAAGLDVRANTHDEVDGRWRPDFEDRGERRPRVSIRKLTATMSRGRFTLDAGKQFIRWGKTDIVVPTDRFAPRDFLTVVDAPFLAVTALRGTVQAGNHTIDTVWAPRFTPSRTPLASQRWTVRPPETPSVPIVESPTTFPDGSQTGVRWGHVADRLEYSISFFDGYNHLPDIRVHVPAVAAAPIEVARVYPAIRTYGADSAVPLPWFTIKAEAAYFTSTAETTDDYVLYVIQLERQRGEWVFVGGYAGEAVTRRRSLLTFAPDRGMSRSIVGRASYTIDTNRSVEMEGAVRQNGEGVYARGEYSQARGQHWRATITAVLIGGETGDFFGQYRRNSHVRLTARYSF